MKIAGMTIDGPAVETVVIPRGEQDIVFKAKAILDYKDFEAMCPVPQPPEIVKPGGITYKNVEDKKYQEAVGLWAQKKTDWMILKSLSMTEGLEWDTVKMDDPDTWANWKDELNSVFTDGEVAALINTVFDVCGLNQKKIEEATKRFLAGQEATLVQ